MVITKKQLFNTDDFRATYNRTGKPSFERKLRFAARKNNMGYKNFNEQDSHFVAETLKKSEKRIRRTGAMSRYSIKKAGQKAYQAYKSGEISKTDYQKAKEIYKTFGSVKNNDNPKKRIIIRRPYLEDQQPGHTISINPLSRNYAQARATGIAHGNTSIGQIIEQKKANKNLGSNKLTPNIPKISPPRQTNSNFRMKV